MVVNLHHNLFPIWNDIRVDNQMTGQINLRQLRQDAIQMEYRAKEIEALAQDLRIKAQRIRKLIQDIKPKTVEKDSEWIDSI